MNVIPKPSWGSSTSDAVVLLGWAQRRASQCGSLPHAALVCRVVRQASGAHGAHHDLVGKRRSLAGFVDAPLHLETALVEQLR